jgi:hypothetical protein
MRRDLLTMEKAYPYTDISGQFSVPDNPGLCPLCQRPVDRTKNEPAEGGPAQRIDGIPSKVNIDPEKVEQGLAKLVLTIVELIRQLLEKQAIQRVQGGSLSDEEIERLGVTLMRLETKMNELKKHFEIDDLNINLGPLGNLVD